MGFNTGAFVFPGDGGLGNAGRAVARSPGFANVETSLFKEWPWGEERSIQLRAEFFNLLNQPDFEHGKRRAHYSVGRTDQLLIRSHRSTPTQAARVRPLSKAPRAKRFEWKRRSNSCSPAGATTPISAWSTRSTLQA